MYVGEGKLATFSSPGTLHEAAADLALLNIFEVREHVVLHIYYVISVLTCGMKEERIWPRNKYFLRK